MGRETKANESSSERRRFKRAHVLFSGSLVSGDQAARGVLLNLSSNGAKVQLAEDFDPSSAVTLRLARSIDLHVQVVWRRGDRLGLAFREAPSTIGSMLAGILPGECLAQ